MMKVLEMCGGFTWTKAVAASWPPCVFYSFHIEEGKADMCSPTALCTHQSPGCI